MTTAPLAPAPARTAALPELKLTRALAASAPVRTKPGVRRLEPVAAPDPLRFSAHASATEVDEGPLPRLAFTKGKPRSLPQPDKWSAAMARSCVEAVLGTRPLHQLTRWLHPDIASALEQHIATKAGHTLRRGMPRRTVRIRKVHPCAVREGVWEAAVLLEVGARVRAAAIRIEEHRGHWRTTAFEIA